MSPATPSTERPHLPVVRIAVVLSIIALCNASSTQASQPDPIRRAPRAVHGRYIVGVRSVADADAVAAMAHGLRRGRVKHVYRKAYHGFAIEASEAAARALALDPAVAHVEEDAVVTAAGVQPLGADDNWGLDRIDQRAATGVGARAYDHVYRYSAGGIHVNVYVVDTGIRTTHAEFGSRAFAAFDARPLDGVEGDCNGHGTHVAGIAGGARFGVAKSVTLHAVRVLGCDGNGYLQSCWRESTRSLRTGCGRPSST
jgi:subtilisin family serine protease